MRLAFNANTSTSHVYYIRLSLWLLVEHCIADEEMREIVKQPPFLSTESRYLNIVEDVPKI